MGKVPHLVLDTNAFLKCIPAHEYGENLVTVEEVTKEIRDKATKQYLKSLPYQVEYRQPFSEYVQLVSEFAKATGDYASLSSVDIRVMALTYQMTKEKLGKEASKFLKSSPKTLERNYVMTPSRNNTAAKSSDEYVSEDDDLDENGCGSEEQDEVDCDLSRLNRLDINCPLDCSPTADKNEINITVPSQTKEQSEKKEQGDGLAMDEHTTGKHEDLVNEESNEAIISDESDSDGGEWITPSNYKTKIKQQSHGALEDLNSDPNHIPVACLTSDFAMQNTMLHMGIKVVSPNGMLIKSLKTYILRCYACFNTTSVMSKKFCPKCGYKTLKKVAVSYNEDGTQNIHLSRRVNISKRGKVFPLPTPQGGKHSVNPHFCEDQQFPHQRPTKMTLAKNNPLDYDYIAESSPFKTKDVYSRAAMLGINSCYNAKGYWDRRNPNEPVKSSGKRRSRK